MGRRDVTSRQAQCGLPPGSSSSSHMLHATETTALTASRQMRAERVSQRFYYSASVAPAAEHGGSERRWQWQRSENEWEAERLGGWEAGSAVVGVLLALWYTAHSLQPAAAPLIPLSPPPHSLRTAHSPLPFRTRAHLPCSTQSTRRSTLLFSHSRTSRALRRLAALSSLQLSGWLTFHTPVLDRHCHSANRTIQPATGFRTS